MRAVSSRQAWLVVLAGLTLAAVAVILASAPVALDRWTIWLVDVQRDLHRRLAQALATVREEGMGAAWPLVALSFGYGVFHAAGPGHGKVVVATYLTTQESRLPGALALTAAAALAQAATAVVAVHAAVTLLGLTLRQARGSVTDLELISFVLVAALGAFLAGRAGRRLWGAPASAACHVCGGRHHAPAAAPGGLWAALGVVTSIGLRPCSGAVVVLLLAYTGDVRLVGVAAALAMAAGTAITTGALAALAVLARGTALKVAERLPGGRGRWTDGAALAGGVALLVLGLLLAHAAWTLPSHPLR